SAKDEELIQELFGKEEQGAHFDEVDDTHVELFTHDYFEKGKMVYIVDDEE
ncbi:hypothetical protein KI387_024366, partial [Taxus chinensis]